MANQIVNIYQTNLLIPNGRILQVTTEDFFYTGGTPSFSVNNVIKNIVNIDVNGLEDLDHTSYNVVGKNLVVFTYNPVIGSKISVNYSY